MWLVGDKFLRDLWPTLIATKSKAIIDRTRKPYIFDYYNVTQCYPGIGAGCSHSTIARMVNEFTKAINDHKNKPLPKYIIMLPDKDIISAVHFGGFGYKVIFEKVIHWMGKVIDNTTQLRKHDLQFKCAGAMHLGDTSVPIIIWVKMIVRPFIKHTDKGYMFAQCKTFNNTSDKILCQYPHTKEVELSLPDDCNLFDLTGNLSPLGNAEVCRELNRLLRQLDHDKKLKTGLSAEVKTPEPQCSRPKTTKPHHVSRRLHHERHSMEHPFQRDTGYSHFEDWSLERAYHRCPITDRRI